MARRVLNLLVIVSAVLFVLATTGWVRSYFVGDSIGWGRGQQRSAIRLSRGRLWVFHFYMPPSRTPGAPTRSYELEVPTTIPDTRPPWATRY